MTEKKPTLCVVAGPNGLGKTTTTVQLPRLLYRTTEGKLFKQYVEDIPEWAEMLVK